MAQPRKTESLFSEVEKAQLQSNAPLAARMRPRNLDEFAGQKDFIGQGKLLRRMLDAGSLSSIIFFGPPGTGKTSLATIIAGLVNAKFNYISAPAATVADIREVIQKAKDNLLAGGIRTVLFIDEIHRFNRAQQDVLLDDVETGVVILIGATTENPYFAINSPLISRSTVFEFKPLEKSDIVELLKRAIKDSSHGLGKLDIRFHEDALEYIAIMSDGDARKSLTALEIAVMSQKNTGQNVIKLDIEVARESIQQKSIVFDPTGDSHYDLASALQKSMRGSDPDATVYWLARLIAGGQDPRFIARRIAVCAAEDVGNADPLATVLAASAMQISEFIGFPEAQLPLAQAAIYIACAPKSNASAKAIWSATSDVKSKRTMPVPKHLKDSHYAGAKKQGYGTEYKYPHDFPNGYVKQQYLPEDAQYYTPTDRGREKIMKEYLQKLENLLKQERS
ncbi:MAG: replication-associated recombination protein A [Planctomycetaceae bacterium]|nr:replication-associated recombination protein A [Planctomycetaceae bacterium]